MLLGKLLILVLFRPYSISWLFVIVYAPESKICICHLSPDWASTTFRRWYPYPPTEPWLWSIVFTSVRGSTLITVSLQTLCYLKKVSHEEIRHENLQDLYYDKNKGDISNRTDINTGCN